MTHQAKDKDFVMTINNKGGTLKVFPRGQAKEYREDIFGRFSQAIYHAFGLVVHANEFENIFQLHSAQSGTFFLAVSKSGNVRGEMK